MIDGDNSVGTITKVEMRGGQAKSAFQSEFPVNAEKIQINLENGVEFWVNSSQTDFTRYLIRTRIK